MTWRSRKRLIAMLVRVDDDGDESDPTRGEYLGVMAGPRQMSPLLHDTKRYFAEAMHDD